MWRYRELQLILTSRDQREDVSSVLSQKRSRRKCQKEESDIRSPKDFSIDQVKDSIDNWRSTLLLMQRYIHSSLRWVLPNNLQPWKKKGLKRTQQKSSKLNIESYTSYGWGKSFINSLVKRVFPVGGMLYRDVFALRLDRGGHRAFTSLSDIGAGKLI